MNKHFLSLICIFTFSILFFASSSPKAALVGKYQDETFTCKTQKNYEEVWSSMIDLFAQNGISIKTIDKSSGIIVSERTSFSNSFTWEVSKGHLNNPNAFVVVGRYDNALTKIVPKTITGDWNIRIKTVGNETVININLFNLYGEHIVHGTGASSGYEYHWQKGGQLDIRSTGVFERKISDMIK